MDNFKETLINIDRDKFTLEQLVSILEQIENKIDINTISETARNEGKSPRGILISNKYRKIMIGKQKMVVLGLDESKLPF